MNTVMKVLTMKKVMEFFFDTWQKQMFDTGFIYIIIREKFLGTK